MRATTRATPHVSRASRAEMMLELSPLDTAAKASACSMPAAVSTSRSNPIPVTVMPVNSVPSRRNASASWSMTATEWPLASKVCAMVEPTRPHPMITMCTCSASRLLNHPTNSVPCVSDGRCASPACRARGTPEPAPGSGRPPVRLAVVARPTSLLKRLLIGRPFRSDRMHHTLLPKRIALPVFASDALSSVAYAPDEILLTLSIGGAAFFAYSPWIALAVVVVMLVVVASYRQNVHAYPSGGGDYEVATVNLGPKFGLVVASALMVDYVLTVAVSVSSGVENLGSAWSFAAEHKVEVAVAMVVILAAMNLRGIREAGIAFAIPTYAFMASILLMIGWGLLRYSVLGDQLRAESANLTVKAPHEIMGFAFLFLMVRTFSSGCTALTGVEAISNGVPAFKPPKSRNAATTLLMLGLLAITMLMGIVTLSRLTHLKLLGPGIPLPAGYTQKTVPAQLADAVFGGFRPAFFLVIATTTLILVLAANTAFNGFPVLGSILAQDRYLPRQLHTRGDRPAFSHGIVFLAPFAILLVTALQATATRLVPAADAAGMGVRPGHPAGHARRGDGERGRRGHPAHPAGVGGAADPGTAYRGRLAVPGDHQADHRLRQVVAPRVAAGRGDGVHPGVRRRQVVGEPVAQPERAAAEGPAAVRAGRHGGQRAVAARVQPAQGPHPAGPHLVAGPRPSRAGARGRHRE